MTPNRIRSTEPIRGQSAYLYAFKDRARKHHCPAHGTFSVELTELEALRKEYSRRVRPVTYVPLYLKAVGLAVARNPEANAILFKNPFGLRVVRFEQVDVNLPIVRSVQGTPTTFIGTVRNAPNKSIADIQAELTAYQRCPPEESYAIRRNRQFTRMPLWLARLVHAYMTWSPRFYVGSVGTCGLTLVEGDWFEYGFSTAPTTALFALGGAQREAVVRDDEVVIARRLKCTLMVDNFVVSGPTGAQLVRDFKELLETGSFIREELAALASG